MTSATKTIPVTELLASKPAWAAAALIAELEHDESDSMTDYFATSTSRRVFLGWSKHTRDLFPEMRKAAALFSDTAHLGPGKGRFTPRVVATNDIVSNGSACWKGSWSPWHREEPNGTTFETLAEAEAAIATAGKPHDIGFGKDGVGTFDWKIETEKLEHREKYSMGAGYYLKGSGRYSSGWTVSKSYLGGLHGTIEILVAPATSSLYFPPVAVAPTTDAEKEIPSAEKEIPSVEKEVLATVLAAVAPVSEPGVTVTLNAAKNGVEIRFPAKPSEEVRTSLKANGWRWSRFSGCWYRKDSADARAFAQSLTEVA